MPQWEALLSRAHSFNLVPRFNFRPRQTLTLRWHLEHMTPTELQRAAFTLASQAYEAGIEIRTLQELSEPFSLVEEPKTSPSSTISQFTPWQAQPERSSLASPGNGDDGTFPLPDQRLPPDLQLLPSHVPLFPTRDSRRSGPHNLEFINPNELFDPFRMANAGTAWHNQPPSATLEQFSDEDKPSNILQCKPIDPGMEVGEMILNAMAFQ